MKNKLIGTKEQLKLRKNIKSFSKIWENLKIIQANQLYFRLSNLLKESNLNKIQIKKQLHNQKERVINEYLYSILRLEMTKL